MNTRDHVLVTVGGILLLFGIGFGIGGLLLSLKKDVTANIETLTVATTTSAVPTISANSAPATSPVATISPVQTPKTTPLPKKTPVIQAVPVIPSPAPYVAPVSTSTIKSVSFIATSTPLPVASGVSSSNYSGGGGGSGGSGGGISGTATSSSASATSTATTTSSIPITATSTGSVSSTSTSQTATSTTSATSTSSGSTGGTNPDQPKTLTCSIFPSNNPWNTDISKVPVDAKSKDYLSVSGVGHLHADFGWKGQYGIPYVLVPSGQAKVPVSFRDYGDESDPGPYPIPDNAPIEGNGKGDSHVIVIELGKCKLYELFVARKEASGWSASSGAIWDLNSNAQRKLFWTSADAAGLPIFAGLARYDEVASGVIKHALRFTMNNTQKGFVFPATHYASSSLDPIRMPMGTRLRLRADFDISKFGPQTKVILQALKTYGMILADNGSNWFISGASDTRWNDDDLNGLKTITASNFEVLETGPITH